MGIDSAGAQLLAAAGALGADFSASLTIGRQFFYPEPTVLRAIVRNRRIADDAAALAREGGQFAEGFFRMLGADRVESLDASNFEGATIVHDLNQPIPSELRGQFSVVYDGGTLEHVFDLPSALRNCMELVREGGWFIQCSPANNFMGHGFYQVSPELMYQVFSPANGYRVVAMLFQESVRGGRWYLVSDPAVVGRRVQMTNSLPTCIWTLAERIATVPIFSTPPQQTDYAAAWNKKSEHGGAYISTSNWRQRAARLVSAWTPPSLERRLRSLWVPSLDAQPDCFRRLDIDRLMRGEIDEARLGRANREHVDHRSVAVCERL